MQLRIQRVQWIESFLHLETASNQSYFWRKDVRRRWNWWENLEISLLLNEDFFFRLLLWCTSTSSYLHNLAPLPRLWEGFLLSSSATYSFVFAATKTSNVLSLVKIFEVDMILWQIWPCNIGGWLRNIGRKGLLEETTYCHLKILTTFYLLLYLHVQKFH